MIDREGGDNFNHPFTRKKEDGDNEQYFYL